MKKLLIIFLIFMMGCTSQKKLEIKPNVIAYRFTGKVEQLLLKQIKEHPNNNYCLLIREEDDLRQIILVTEYSYYHKNTSYYALIGRNYYPISFPQFDRKYGVVENAEHLLQRKIDSDASEDFLTKQSYPMYHGMYKIELNSKNYIVFEGYVY